jgi:hypothetical protein
VAFIPGDQLGQALSNNTQLLKQRARPQHLSNPGLALAIEPMGARRDPALSQMAGKRSQDFVQVTD